MALDRTTSMLMTYKYTVLGGMVLMVLLMAVARFMGEAIKARIRRDDPDLYSAIMASSNLSSLSRSSREFSRIVWAGRVSSSVEVGDLNTRLKALRAVWVVLYLTFAATFLVGLAAQARFNP